MKYYYHTLCEGGKDADTDQKWKDKKFQDILEINMFVWFFFNKVL